MEFSTAESNGFEFVGIVAKFNQTLASAISTDQRIRYTDEFKDDAHFTEYVLEHSLLKLRLEFGIETEHVALHETRDRGKLFLRFVYEGRDIAINIFTPQSNSGHEIYGLETVIMGAYPMKIEHINDEAIIQIYQPDTTFEYIISHPEDPTVISTIFLDSNDRYVGRKDYKYTRFRDNIVKETVVSQKGRITKHSFNWSDVFFVDSADQFFSKPTIWSGVATNYGWVYTRDKVEFRDSKSCYIAYTLVSQKMLDIHEIEQRMLNGEYICAESVVDHDSQGSSIATTVRFFGKEHHFEIESFPDRAVCFYDGEKVGEFFNEDALSSLNVQVQDLFAVSAEGAKFYFYTSNFLLAVQIESNGFAVPRIVLPE